MTVSTRPTCEHRDQAIIHQFARAQPNTGGSISEPGTEGQYGGQK